MNGLQISREKALKLVEQFDVDKDGVIDVKEFEAPGRYLFKELCVAVDAAQER